jgi:hypothetical protein
MNMSNNRLSKISNGVRIKTMGMLVLAIGFTITGCANMGDSIGGGVKKGAKSYESEPVIQDIVCQGFLDAVSTMADGLLSAPAIASVTKPPLVVIHSLNNESAKNFNSQKYIEAERAMLIKKGGVKVRFVDKETEEKADYYLLSIIADMEKGSGLDKSNRSVVCQSEQSDLLPTIDGSIPLKRNCRSILCAAMAEAQIPEEDEYNVVITHYQLTLKLVNPESGDIAWKETKEFQRKELQSVRPRGVKSRLKR